MNENLQTGRGGTLCTIEARMGSTRLPGKVLRPIGGMPMLQLIVERIRQARTLDRILIATADTPDNEPLREFGRRLGVPVFSGSEDDVLGRVAAAVARDGADTVVALTGDNPFIDPVLIDDVVEFFRSDDYDYVTTSHMQYAPDWGVERSFPRGVSVQVLRARVLLEVAAEVTDVSVREHATYAIYARPDRRYRLGAFQAEGRYAGWRAPELRLTVDTPEDFDLSERIVARLMHERPMFSTHDVIKLLRNEPALAALNREVRQKAPPPLTQGVSRKII